MAKRNKDGGLRAPNGLGSSGKRLWVEITSGAYLLRPDEVRLVEDVCRIADRIDQMEKLLASSALMVTGSQGQEVLHPLVAEQRQQRATLASLMKRLDLPDTVGTTDADRRQSQARAAANARWAVG